MMHFESKIIMLIPDQVASGQRIMTDKLHY